MDLLDSILGNMAKPPEIKRPVIKDEEKRKKMEKIQKSRQEVIRKQKENLEKFRQDAREQISQFYSLPATKDNPKSYRLEFKPMSQVLRSIIHEIVEDNYDEDLVVHSFGKEEVDRHSIVWKREFEPCEEELKYMRLGLEYNPDKQKLTEADLKSLDVDESKIEDKFRDKYEKIVGKGAGVETAKVAVPAKQYGCVPIENKQDQRSIEQIMDDVRKSKRAKLESCEEPTTSDSQPKVT